MWLKSVPRMGTSVAFGGEADIYMAQINGGLVVARREVRPPSDDFQQDKVPQMYQASVFPFVLVCAH